MRFVTAKEFTQHFHISNATLFLWRKTNKIRFKQLSARKILYDIDSLDDDQNSVSEKRMNVVYARVSCTNQKEQLEKQIEIIKGYMMSNGVKVDKVYSDIGSGMNGGRINLNIMLEDIHNLKIDTVYISYKDRLTRFGFDYLRNMFNLCGTKIVILDTTDSENVDFKNELANDLISIIHHYSMKLYSNRRKQLKEIETIISSNK